MSNDPKSILRDAETKMKQTLQVLESDLQGIRTGRASTALVEKVTVEYYGTATPLIQLAGISIPEPQTIMINPYDRTTIGDIEKALLASDLGLTPSSDGSVIRLNIPPLTTDRRKELMKRVNKRLEESRVSVRNIRRTAMEEIKAAEKGGDISEDAMHNAQEEAQKLTDDYIKKVEETGKRKEDEIMDV
jgi:ribosome recycling factor